MGTGYTRADVSNNIADGNIINASDIDNEYDAIEAAFNSSTGHTHDGTSAEGGAITVVGPVQDLVVSATEVKPKTTNTLDLGTSALLYKDAYLQGNMYFRDTALKIVSSADGQLDIDADVELELVAPTVDIDASTALTVDTASTTFTSTLFNVTGSANITGDLDVDNINIDGNTIISTDTNGAINITPNGTGAVNITATTNITGDLDVDNININGNTIISTDTNGNIALTPNGTGEVDISKVDIASGEIDGTTIGANSAAAITGTTITGTSFVSSGDMTFGDSDKAVFGAGADLEISHNGIENVIDSNAGTLVLRSAGAGTIELRDQGSQVLAQFNDNADAKLYYNNNLKIATTATGCDVTGTVTADGLTVSGDAVFTPDNDGVRITGANYATLRLEENDTTDLNTTMFNSGGKFSIFTSSDDRASGTERVTLDHSTGSVGIGTTSPARDLHINGTAANAKAFVRFTHDGLASTGLDVGYSSGGFASIYNAENTAMAFSTNATERMRIDNSGNVGIGTTSPSTDITKFGGSAKGLSVAAGQPAIAVRATANAQYVGYFGQVSTNTYLGAIGGGSLIIQTGTSGTERLRIDSSGDLIKNGGVIKGERGTAAAPAYTFSDDTDTGMFNISNADLGFSVGGSEAMRINSSGFVGIGTTSPSRLLSLNSSNASIDFSNGTWTNEIINSAGQMEFRADHTNAAASSVMTFSVDGDEAVRIDSSGNVGIGATSPSSTYRASIHGDGSSIIGGIEFRNAAAGGSTFTIGHSGTGSPSATLNVVSSANMIFKTDDTERMRIDSNGKLCVGTTSAVTSAMLTIQPADTNRIINTRNFNTTTQFHHVFQNSAGSTVGSIQCNNAATAYNTSSDYRLKTAVNYDWDATSRLKQLKPARFEWIIDGDDAVPVDGFLAHEVQDVVPEAISGTKDGMMDEEYEVTPAVEATYDDDGNILTEAVPAVMGTRSVPDYQGIDQSKLVPLLVKTIQELEARIAALEAN
jgi:cytoskeletal protein CcmA (bactofilin family)